MPGQRVSLIVIRLWLEEPGDSGIRGRIMIVDDLAAGIERSEVVAGADAVKSAVSSHLRAIVEDAVGFL